MHARGKGDPIALEEQSWRYAGWRIVAALFLVQVAMFGFGLYGQGILVAELRRLNGWPTGVIATGSTFYLVMGSLLSMFVDDLLRRFGARSLILAGLAALGAGLGLLAFAETLLQLYAGFAVLSLAWVGLGTITVASVIGAWFSRKRGLAISLAFTGATVSGMLLMPGLVLLVEAIGFRRALSSAALITVIVLVPVVALLVRSPHAREHGPAHIAHKPAVSRSALLRDAGFLCLTLCFALAVMVQVGFIVHQISILTPAIGFQAAGGAVSLTTAMSLTGRLALAVTADRVEPRWVAAASIVSQAIALAVIGSSNGATALYLACAVFGFSIGNLVTLPALLIHREFAPAAFGTVLGLSMAIAGVINSCGPAAMGLLRDLTGDYATPIAIGVAIQLISAAGILLAPQPRYAADQIGLPA